MRSEFGHLFVSEIKTFGTQKSSDFGVVLRFWHSTVSTQYVLQINSTQKVFWLEYTQCLFSNWFKKRVSLEKLMLVCILSFLCLHLSFYLKFSRQVSS